MFLMVCLELLSPVWDGMCIMARTCQFCHRHLTCMAFVQRKRIIRRKVMVKAMVTVTVMVMVRSYTYGDVYGYDLWLCFMVMVRFMATLA